MFKPIEFLIMGEGNTAHEDKAPNSVVAYELPNVFGYPNQIHRYTVKMIKRL